MYEFHLDDFLLVRGYKGGMLVVCMHSTAPTHDSAVYCPACLEEG